MAGVQIYIWQPVLSNRILMGMAKPDIDLLVKQLRARGHEVKYVHSVPDNAGYYEFTIDGEYLNLEEARQVLERDEQP